MTAPEWLPMGLRPLGHVPLRSDMTSRSAARLAFVVSQFLVEVSLRYQGRDVTGDGRAETFCNFFARDVCFALGVSLPEAMRANEIHDWLLARATEKHAPGWEVVDGHVAQRMADEGQVALASWKNPSGGPGHIAVLVPSLGESGIWIAQAGRENFSRGRVERGFGTLPVTYFAHP